MLGNDMPIGLDENYLIEPEYILAKSWSLYILDDRLFREQIQILISAHATKPGALYGIYDIGYGAQTSTLEHNASSLDQFMIETSSEHIAILDMPNTFMLSVLYGDLSIVATDRLTLKSMFKADEMSQNDWNNIFEQITPELAKKLRLKYLFTSNK